MPRSTFSPFFTLVDDVTRSSTHHPVNVRYIFSDDDQDVLTSACLASIPGPSSQSSSDFSTRSSSSSSTTSREQTSKSQIKLSRDIREPEHRTLLLDLDETGTAITSAHSLSSSWQILSTNLTPAPTWEASPTADEEAIPARFMLRIEGTQGKGGRREREKASGKPKEEGGDVRTEDFQALVEDFQTRMKVLRTVMEAGDKRLGKPENSREDEEDGEKDQAKE